MTQNGNGPVKAYRNPAFIGSREGRPIRIMAEYLEPEARFEEARVSDTIVFMGSARTLPRADAEAALKEARAEGGDVKAAERDLVMSRYYEDARTLSRRLTEWSKGLVGDRRRFLVCTGGGPGIMEAANRGASEAKGLNVGLNISLPMEQHDNPYITRQLSFEFHYFFMRKFWFVYLAKAVVIFPGGFGTLDEFSEILTLIQTRKLEKPMPVVLYGREYWDQVMNLDAMVEWGTISPEDVELFHSTDSVDDAFTHITERLSGAVEKPGGSL